ncbi:hypothetical protein [Candidatus Acidianus copahuensis]|nr:hypothetical protein [Candidatus Acidianus copahuensis]
MKYGDLTVTKLSKLSGVKPWIVKRELDFLSKSGYIDLIEGSRSTIVKLNYSNQKVIILMNLLQEIEEL